MALAFYGLPRFQASSRPSVGSPRAGRDPKPAAARRRCLRCGTLYRDSENSPTACSFHGHTTGLHGTEPLGLHPSARTNTKEPHLPQHPQTRRRRPAAPYCRWRPRSTRPCFVEPEQGPKGKHPAAVPISHRKAARTPAQVAREGERNSRANLYLGQLQLSAGLQIWRPRWDLGCPVPGERGLFALSPPHQGIDGEWSDGSGLIVYKWNERNDRPNTGRSNWKKRWSCCAEYDEDAPPCRLGWHVCYDDGFTLY